MWWTRVPRGGGCRRASREDWVAGPGVWISGLVVAGVDVVAVVVGCMEDVVVGVVVAEEDSIETQVVRDSPVVVRSDTAGAVVCILEPVLVEDS